MLVSIGFPTYNSAKRIRKSLESLLAQKYENFELIISDNASTDETGDICREYAQKDKRIKYFRQDRNAGLVKNFEFVSRKASGEYYMWAADDDWWHPDFILKLKEALDCHLEHGIAMCSLRQVHEDGSLANEIFYDGLNNLSNFSYGRVFNAVIFKNPPAHFFIMGLFRREIFERLFWEPAPRVLGPDKVLMYEAALFTHFYSIPDILWTRTTSLLPDAQRYTGDYKRIFVDKKAHLKHVGAALSRLARSPNISLVQKIKFMPTKSVVLIWGFRKHLFRELFPWGYNFWPRLK